MHSFTRAISSWTKCQVVILYDEIWQKVVTGGVHAYEIYDAVLIMHALSAGLVKNSNRGQHSAPVRLHNVSIHDHLIQDHVSSVNIEHDLMKSYWVKDGIIETSTSKREIELHAATDNLRGNGKTD